MTNLKLKSKKLEFKVTYNWEVYYLNKSKSS